MPRHVWDLTAIPVAPAPAFKATPGYFRFVMIDFKRERVRYGFGLDPQEEMRTARRRLSAL
jgi:hypothetical protein